MRSTVSQANGSKGAVVTPVGRRGLPTRFGSSAGGKASRAQAHLVGCGLDDASDRRDAGQGQCVLLTPGFAQHPQRLFTEVGVARAQALKIARTKLGPPSGPTLASQRCSGQVMQDSFLSSLSYGV